MRNCCTCKVELVKGDNWALSGEKAGVYKCKSCIKITSKLHRQNNLATNKEYWVNHYKENKSRYIANLERFMDGLYHVYMRKDGYVGATTNLNMRAIKHKTILCVLHSTESASKASELEEFLHDSGYKGKGKKTYAQQLGI